MVTRVKKEIKAGSRGLNRVALCLHFLLGSVWLSLLIFTLVRDPIMLALKQYTKVKNGSFVHEFLLKETESIHLRVFLFNITNARQFVDGIDPTLKVEEFGPFTYREIRSNVDIVIDEERARMFYTPQIRIEFVEEMSIGRPEDVIVTMPNIPMLGQASKMASYPYITQFSFNLLASQISSKPVVTLDAFNYLWGYEEPLVTLSHSLMPGSVPFDRMGILDRIYDPQKKPRIEVSIADEDKYTLKTINGHKRLAMGESEDPDTCALCSTLDDTYEGIGYRPEVDSSFRINLFRVGVCRTFEMEFNGTKDMDYGAAALVYRFKDSFFTLDPNASFSGVLALPDCFLGVPLAFSKPHLQDVDPHVYDRIEGLRPDPERFPAWIAVEPKMGLQLETVISLQLNLVIGDVSFNPEAKNFANMVLPIAFLQIEQPPLPEESKFFLSGIYHKGPWLVLAGRCVLLILLVVSWGLVARVLYRHHTSKPNMPQTHPLATCDITKEINSNLLVEELLLKQAQMRPR